MEAGELAIDELVFEGAVKRKTIEGENSYRWMENEKVEAESREHKSPGRLPGRIIEENKL